jgi:hypothetical protein
MVLINNSTEKQTITTERFSENLKKYSKGTDVITQKTIAIQQPIVLEPKTGLVLELH